MTNFIFGEIKGNKKNNNITNNTTNIKDMKFYGEQNFLSFVTCKPYDDDYDYNIKSADNITNEFVSGRYELKTKYALLYLYDIFGDAFYENQEFLNNYGAKLHNYSSANFSIITYFNEDNCKIWKNVQNPKMIECSSLFCHDCDEITKRLKQAYGVHSDSAIVVIKYDKETGNEESFNVDVTRYHGENLFNVFKEIMDTINDNCDQDLDYIKTLIVGPDSSVQKGNISSEYFSVNFIEYLIKKGKNYTRDMRMPNIKEKNVAYALCIFERAFRYKKTNNSFTRDECIGLGAIFNLTIEKLNELLTACGHSKLGKIERDQVIRDYLLDLDEIDSDNIIDLDRLLAKENYPKLIKDKQRETFEKKEKEKKEKMENEGISEEECLKKLEVMRKNTF